MGNELQGYDNSILTLTGTEELARFSDAELRTIALSLSECKSAFQRIENEHVFIAAKLSSLHAMLGDQLFPIAEAELNMRKHKVQRFLRFHKTLMAHFATEGRIDLGVAKHITKGALNLLNPDTDDDVIDEVRGLAENGNKITEKTIQDLLRSRQEGFDSQLAQAQAEARQSQREADMARDAKDLEVGRLQNQLTSTAEMNRRLTEQKAAAEAELQQLRERPQQGVPVEIEIPPAGYTTVAEAIADAEAELARVVKAKEENERELGRLSVQKKELETSIASIESDNAEIIEIKSAINAIMLRYPMAKLRAISANNAHKMELDGLAQAMIDLGKNLHSALQQA